MHRTKIVCTLGPASDKKSIIKQLMKNGMNVCRLNFSHGTLAYHSKLIKNIRAAAAELKMPVAIIQDLQGPRIRIGDLGVRKINLKDGQKIALGSAKLPITFEEMSEHVRPGERILIADGIIELRVEKIIGKEIHCTVVRGGVISSHKGINLPDTDLNINCFTEKDKKDFQFGLKSGVDFAALSFVRDASDLEAIRERAGKDNVKIIAKIERQEAVKNIDEIIEAADGIMIGRGDLGIELPPEDVPVIQKMIIDKCLKAAKPVIVATQMLESMVNNPRPTRAEVSDVANAVIDHTDAVMLSEETAIGKFPAEAVLIMKKTIEETEASVYDDLVMPAKINSFRFLDESFSLAIKSLSEKSKAKFIVGATNKGWTARIISRYRPEMPIYISCIDEKMRDQLCLTWGIITIPALKGKTQAEFIISAKNFLKNKKLLKKGGQFICFGGLAGEKIDFIELVTI